MCPSSCLCAYVCGTYISLCVYRTVFVCVCVWICLPSPKQPKSAQTVIIFTLLSELLFFFLLTYIYRQKKRAFPILCSLSICLSLTLEREEEEEPKQKCTQTYSEIHRQSGSCYKLCFLHWQQKRRFNYFGMDALVTKYRPFYSFVHLHFLFSFARLFL